MSTPLMQNLLKADGLVDLANVSIGAKITIEEKPGIFVGLVTYFPHRKTKSLIEFGGVKETSINGKVVQRKSLLY